MKNADNTFFFAEIGFFQEFTRYLHFFPPISQFSLGFSPGRWLRPPPGSCRFFFFLSHAPLNFLPQVRPPGRPNAAAHTTGPKSDLSEIAFNLACQAFSKPASMPVRQYIHNICRISIYGTGSEGFNMLPIREVGVNLHILGRVVQWDFFFSSKLAGLCPSAICLVTVNQGCRILHMRRPGKKCISFRRT